MTYNEALALLAAAVAVIFGGAWLLERWQDRKDREESAAELRALAKFLLGCETTKNNGGTHK